MTPARRLIVECTHTFHTGAGTGIQRVVRRFSDELLALGPEYRLEVVPVRVAGNALVPLPLEASRVAFPRAASARESAGQPEPAPRLARALHATASALQRASGSRRLARWLAASPNEGGYVRSAAALARGPAPAGAIQLSADDVLLCLDSSWVYDIRSALEAAGRSGAARFAVLCDVLPLSQPQWFTEGTRRWFRGWIETLLPRLEGVVTISEATRAELARLVAEGAIAASALPASAAVHLGAELGAVVEAPIRGALAESLAPGRPPAFLTVGTLEPRKNVDFALDLFDALAARGLDFQWHIVGAPGWLAEHTAQRIHGHAAFGGRLRWWTDLNDAELACCYAHACACVQVSKAEGFGLPLVEARLHDLPVFASDIAVFREVMGEEAGYLPLDDAPRSAALLEQFLGGDRARTPSRIARPWRESARELLDTILRMRAARRG